MHKSTLTMNNNYFCFSYLVCIVTLAFAACQSKPEGPLPVLGNQQDLDGQIIEHTVRDFSFINQLGDTVSNSDLVDDIYVVDFFFTSCPSICPKVKKQMLRIYEYTKDNPNFKLLSHTIDPKRDSIAVLKTYADNIGIDHDRWYFLYGPKDQILTIANEDYFIAALEDKNAPGGFDHSGKIILVDKQRRIRGFCDGTDPASVTNFLTTIDRLTDEYR